MGRKVSKKKRERERKKRGQITGAFLRNSRVAGSTIASLQTSEKVDARRLSSAE